MLCAAELARQLTPKIATCRDVVRPGVSDNRRCCGADAVRRGGQGGDDLCRIDSARLLSGGDPEAIGRTFLVEQHAQNAIRAVAERQSLLALARLLRGGSPRPSVEPALGEPTQLTDRSGRPLTLGERKALARQPSRASFERLLRDPHPMVIRTLLKKQVADDE